MNDYTPDQIAQADQTLAGIHHQLDRLIALASPDPHDVEHIDALGEILLDTLSVQVMAATLSVAIHKLAAAR
jgi:hypothetical protein